VLDPLAGYLRYVEAVATDASAPKTLNFGPRPDDVLTVAELAATMLTAAGAPSGWRQDPGPFPSEKHDLALDATLAGETIGWRPRMSSGDAVRWTAEWHSRLAGGESARSLCVEQISRYESLP
jgi:CDP-glucose 4,6-dehydratase